MMSSTLTQACNDDAIDKLLTSPNADYKEDSSESSLPSVTKASAPSSTFDEEGICG
jgi:hypothetical protein